MNVILENFLAYLAGFAMSVKLSFVAGAVAMVWGLVLAALRVSPLAPLRGFATAYVELLRNTPLTLVFFFLAFVAPQFGVKISLGFAVAVVALSLYTASFVCEAVRSGINSVGMGQAEAARAIGFTFGQTLSLIVLPQAVRTVIPPLISVFIALAKNTSVAAGFATVELVATGRRLTVTNPDDTIWILVGVAMFYLAITIPSGIIAGIVERKVAFAR